MHPAVDGEHLLDVDRTGQDASPASCGGTEHRGVRTGVGRCGQRLGVVCDVGGSSRCKGGLHAVPAQRGVPQHRPADPVEQLVGLRQVRGEPALFTELGSGDRELAELG